MGKENKTVYVILGLLNHEDLSGYDIKKRIDHSLSYFWGTGFGQIYPTLTQMELKEWVTKTEASVDGMRKRNLYSITELGKQQLLQWLSEPAEREVVKYEILLKLFFGSEVGAGKNIENLNSFKQNYLEQIPVLTHFESELKGVMAQSPDHLYYLLTVMFGKKIYEAYVEWASEAIKLIEQTQKEG